MYRADGISVRLHILLCAVEQYADGLRPPFKNDNLPEMLQHIIKNPTVKIKMAQAADWMICAPCPSRVPGLNACMHVEGHCGLENELKDLRVLQKIGLKYGDSMKAKDLYKLIFDKIKTTNEVCALEGIFSSVSVWRDPCGEGMEEVKENERYKKGRRMLMDALGILEY